GVSRLLPTSEAAILHDRATIDEPDRHEAVPTAVVKDDSGVFLRLADIVVARLGRNEGGGVLPLVGEPNRGSRRSPGSLGVVGLDNVDYPQVDKLPATRLFAMDGNHYLAPCEEPGVLGSQWDKLVGGRIPW